MRRRLADQEGMTLVEMMVTLTIGMGVLLATFSLLDGATRRSDDSQRRSAAIQQGRAAMDEVVRSLRSQVCVRTSDTTILSPIQSASDTSVTYFTDFGDGSGLADKHVLTLTGGTLTDAVYKGTGTANATAFPNTPTSSRTIARDISGVTGVPAFHFFAFNTAVPPTPDRSLNSSSAPTVDPAELGNVARIEVSLQANPEGVANAKLITPLRDQVYVRLADPDDPVPSPRCA